MKCCKCLLMIMRIKKQGYLDSQAPEKIYGAVPGSTQWYTRQRESVSSWCEALGNNLIFWNKIL